jgi:two-component system, NtrC family, response regulator AlgB
VALDILVVDDEPNIRTLLRFCLADEHHVVEAGSLAEATLRLSESDFDIAFVDLRLGDGDGMQLLPKAPSTAVVIMTAFGSIESAVQAMRQGAAEYLQKPFTAPQVKHLVERILLERRVRGELQHLRAQAAARSRLDTAARSPAMKQLLAMAAKVAPTEATVLITGESGTGKGLLARYLHDHSTREGGPFITVDLSSLASSLLESELFGHARGAFTGASTAVVGRIETARGGTLFLDEIGELPLSLQSKLLRLVQEQQFERVGESTTRQGDVRIIAASNRDLKQMVAAGQFREDLYYRLRVLGLAVPPLRERREDILPLAEELLQRARQRTHGSVRRFSDEAKAILLRYRWPGNVRELQNSVERAAIIGEGEVADAGLFAAEAESLTPDIQDSEGDSLAAAERRHIASVIARYPTMEEAARALGVDVVTLWRRRKKYGLD